MKRFEFIQVLMLLLMCVSAHAQQFTLTVDTVKVDTSDMTCSGTFASRLSFIAKQKDKIYCLYNSKGVVRVDGKCRFNQLLTLDEMGQIQQFPLSDDVTYNISRGEGLFVRNDSLILRTHGSYSTSVFTVKWEKEHGYKDDEIATPPMTIIGTKRHHNGFGFPLPTTISMKISSIRYQYGRMVNGAPTRGS